MKKFVWVSWRGWYPNSKFPSSRFKGLLIVRHGGIGGYDLFRTPWSVRIFRKYGWDHFPPLKYWAGGRKRTIRRHTHVFYGGWKALRIGRRVN